MPGFGDLRAIADITDGSPYPKIVPVASPAAGADFTIVAPGGFVWQLLGITATLTTSVAAANRGISLRVTDGTDQVARLALGANVTASLTTVVSWVRGATQAVGIIGGVLTGSLPDELVVPAGYNISTVTALIDAADQWSSIHAWVIELPDGQQDRLYALAEAMAEHRDAFAEYIMGSY